MAVWCSGNALVLINAVALHRVQVVLGWVQCLNCEKRSGGTLEARRRGERRRRENRGSVGAEGEGNGFPPPQPTRESGEKWHGDQTRREKCLNGRPRMLTRDLFAVAKILVDH